jgi:hypothetical protein
MWRQDGDSLLLLRNGVDFGARIHGNRFTGRASTKGGLFVFRRGRLINPAVDGPVTFWRIECPRSWEAAT